jgi:Domain of unknown function (DUF3883)
MLRLNVAAGQLEECVRLGMFALSGKSHIDVGEVLLLQLKKVDWHPKGTSDGRIKHALVFQRVEHDKTGKISKLHWPDANKVWPWILYSSAVLDVKPFSLEKLPLNRESHYQAQANPVRIDADDEAIILPYLDWSSAIPLTGSHQVLDEQVSFATDDTSIVEQFAVDRAVVAVKKLFPLAHIEVMKHNNPGFDLTVTQGGKVVRYIEVKGTRSAAPFFHLTETERKFSAENAALYTMLVIWKIDLNKGTYKLSQHDGEASLDSILRPERYTGRLPIDGGEAELGP